MSEEPGREDVQQAMDKAVLTAKIIHISIGLAVVAHLVVAYAIGKMNEPFSGFAELPEPVKTILRCVLWGLSALSLPMALFLRHMMSRPALVQASVRTLSQFRAFFIRNSAVTAAVLCEPAIWGFILFLLAGRLVDLVGLGAISLVYMAILFPSMTRASELARHMAGSDEE